AGDRLLGPGRAWLGRHAEQREGPVPSGARSPRQDRDGAQPLEHRPVAIAADHVERSGGLGVGCSALHPPWPPLRKWGNGTGLALGVSPPYEGGVRGGSARARRSARPPRKNPSL